MNSDIILSIPITLGTAVLWLRVLRRWIPYYDDKRLPVALPSFFAWGLLSVPLLYLLYEFWPDLWFYGSSISAETWNQIIMVGIIEELAKWLIFALLMHKTRPLRSPEDGILFAAATALAFATVENVIYVARYGLYVLWLRSFLATAGHMSYAALWGFVWAGVTYEEAGEINRKLFPWALAAIVPVGVIHGLYNSSLSVFGMTGGIILDLLVLMGVLGAYRYLVQHSPYRRFPFREARQAVNELTRALQINPRSLILQRRRAIYYLRLREYERAESDFSTAWLRTGKKSTALEMLIQVARFSADSASVNPEEITRLYRSLPEGARRAIARELPLALRSERTLERALITIFAGLPLQRESMQEKRELARQLRSKKLATKKLEVVAAAQQEDFRRDEKQRRRAAVETMSEQERQRLLRQLRSESR